MPGMSREQVWKNFDLGAELGVAGAFIYNGLRRFHDMHNLENADEVFEVLYGLAVGLERLLKVAVVMLGHRSDDDQEEFAQRLRTHDHADLLGRVRRLCDLKLSKQHDVLLELLRTFYADQRYDRFNLAPSWHPDKEKHALRNYLEQQLNVTLKPEFDLMPIHNDDRYRRFLGKVSLGLSRELFRCIRNRAYELNLYTYELRSGSKAEWVFLSDEVDFTSSDIAWKEVLVYLMNTADSYGWLGLLRSIEPLEFDPAMVDEYLGCLNNESERLELDGELEVLYEAIDDVGDRLEMLKLIDNPTVTLMFDEEEDEDLEDIR